jgi:hypothetical protein
VDAVDAVSPKSTKVMPWLRGRNKTDISYIIIFRATFPLVPVSDFMRPFSCINPKFGLV